MDFSRELDVALSAAAGASRYLQEAYGQFTAVADAPATISTDADRQSQELILAALALSFPNDALCAEEQTPTLQSAQRSGQRTWIVDPIDGSRGFVMKNGEFSVMIGLVVDSAVVVGVVAEPALARTTFARKGSGCWVATASTPATRCRVAATPKLTEATLVQSHAKKGEHPWPVAALRPRRVVETYSAGVKLAQVARGEADIYVNIYPNFSDWDICAGDLLVTEAGGAVSQLDGRPIRYNSAGNSQRGGLLATNGSLHVAAVAALNGSQC